jgi:hypothetical protein
MLKAIVVDLNASVLEGLSPRQRGCFLGALRRVIQATEAQLRGDHRPQTGRT